MSLEKVLAISGKPGLYELLVQTRTGFIAESLADGKKSTVGLKNNVSLLSEISIYTYNEEVKLFDVFKNIATKENNGEAISHKEDNPTLLGYFREVLPEFDEERVYVSDIKKVLNWYNILQRRGIIAEAFTEAAVETEAK
ncbi:DUF5606 domain-containing protein [Myroides sp. M-43]|uniref:DUF5606 family protein n=1 Tax=Myroides oncorhynchi TaxID=2893756 RepID=UPI001E29F247|nr:DUF5606 domain-containing protein [Myroides oncorhynchi]MCC9043930.1 DUF5606 domain-containing protein [Myroides oncorhynchi]